MRLIAIVGMPGSGKTEAADFFERSGFHRIRFGDTTIEEVKRRGLRISEKNERLVREGLRKKHGMDAYAKLSVSKIDMALKSSDVIIDGLYSWEEFTFLKKKYGSRLTVIAVYASPKTRQARLGKRRERPLTQKECEERDRAQIENLRTGPPIAMADFTVVNECSLKGMKKSLEEMLKVIK